MTFPRLLLLTVFVLTACGSSTSTDGGTADTGSSDPCTPRTFHFTSDGASYSVDGVVSPTLTLCRGVTYVFDMSMVSAFHPMDLRSGGAMGTTLATMPPAMTTSFTVPAAAPFPDIYICEVHGFNGAITVP